MSQPTIVLLAPTTSAIASAPFSLDLNNGKPVSVTCAGLAGSETGNVQSQDPISGTWSNYYQGTTQIQFTATITALDIWNTALTYRVNKSSSASAVGVSLSFINAVGY